LQFWRRIQLKRLTTRNQFQAVLAGATVARTTHFALHCVALKGPVAIQKTLESSIPPKPELFGVKDVWVGAMVPKRWAKRAVTRNAIKRQIYSVSASFESALPQAAHVLRLRASFDRTEFPSATSQLLKATVRNELLQLFTSVIARPYLPKAQLSAP
jgi:ribonuclease P protein component